MNGLPGVYTNVFAYGGRTDLQPFIGPMDLDNGSDYGYYVYCIEYDTDFDDDEYQTAGWATADSSEQRVAAYMIAAHQSDTNDEHQAAVATAIHNHIDVSATDQWEWSRQNVDLETGDWDAIDELGEEYWEQAVSVTPDSVTPTITITSDDLSSGVVDPGIMTMDGGYADDVSYTMTISGPAVFDDTGTTTYSGTTTGSEEQIAWSATGSGTVTISVECEQEHTGKVKTLTSQDLFTTSDETRSVSGKATLDATPLTVTTSTERIMNLSDPIHDTAMLTGTIPDDSYCVEFELWRQSDSDDVDEDELVTTTECVAVEAGENPTVDSPEVTVDEPGVYYWRERLIRYKDTDSENTVSYEGARTEEETVYLIRVTTNTERVMDLAEPVHDTALIEGTLPDGDYCMEFELWRQTDSDDADEDTLITTTECVAVEPGVDVTVDSPDVTVDGTGTYYWRERLIKDKDTDDELEVSYGDVRVGDETVYLISVATSTKDTATVGDNIHDTAVITGTIPDDTYCVEFELWEQSDSDDPADDTLVTTTECVPVEAGDDPTVDSPDVTVDVTGTYYWRERLIQDKDEDTEREVSYGDARVEEETVTVSEGAGLAQTGVTTILPLGVMLLTGGAGIMLHRRRSLR